MMSSNRLSYNQYVVTSRLRSWGTATAGALGLLVFALDGPAAADPSIYGVGNSAVVNINIDGGNLLVKTWDRQAVQTETAGQVQAQQVGAQTVAQHLPREFPVLAASVDTPAHGTVTLPEETFVLSSVSGAPHDAVVIKTQGDTVVTIPQSAALVVARGRGAVTLDGYKSGTFFVRLQNGFVHLQNMGGEGFVQVMRGSIYANDSSFGRLRTRVAQGGMLFERCHARQIQATALTGSIVYDNGSFEPGLARFESEFGHVALGVDGNAEIGAHSNSGHIFTNFDRRANVDMHPNDANARLGGGGATVTASAGGAVLIYDGTMQSRNAANLSPVWRGVREAFNRISGRAVPPQELLHRPLETQPGAVPRAPGPAKTSPRFPRGHRGHPP